MADVSTVQARDQISDLLNRVSNRKERIIIKRRNRALAALVPIEDLDLLKSFEDKMDIKAANKAMREVKRKGTIKLQDLEYK